MGQKFQKVMEVVQYSADPPGKHQAWKNIGKDLPFDDTEKFIAFDESLKNNEEKKKHWYLQIIQILLTNYLIIIYK